MQKRKLTRRALKAIFCAVGFFADVALIVLMWVAVLLMFGGH